MNRVLAFSGRNLKELLRDPLSYIFCLGFPLVMLVIMSIVNQSIPPESGMTIFNIENLAGGIAMFGQSFIMLFTCLSVSKDRSGAFLTRLYASPMKSFDFIAGYTFPVLALSVIQSVITFAASMTAGAVMGTNTISAGGALMAVVVLIPGAVFFIAAGLLFGIGSRCCGEGRIVCGCGTACDNGGSRGRNGRQGCRHRADAPEKQSFHACFLHESDIS